MCRDNRNRTANKGRVSEIRDACGDMDNVHLHYTYAGRRLISLGNCDIQSKREEKDNIRRKMAAIGYRPCMEVRSHSLHDSDIGFAYLLIF